MRTDELADIALVILGAIGIILLITVAAMELSGCGRQREERGERRARVEAIMWHEECADLQEAAMERYEERRGR